MAQLAKIKSFTVFKSTLIMTKWCSKFSYVQCKHNISYMSNIGYLHFYIHTRTHTHGVTVNTVKMHLIWITELNKAHEIKLGEHEEKLSLCCKCQKLCKFTLQTYKIKVHHNQFSKETRNLYIISTTKIYNPRFISLCIFL